MNSACEGSTSRSDTAAGAPPAPWPEIVAFSGGRNGVNSLRVRLEPGAEETLFVRAPTPIPPAEPLFVAEKAAFMEGKTIQGRCGPAGAWADTDAPGWFGDCEYRIKPELQS